MESNFVFSLPTHIFSEELSTTFEAHRWLRHLASERVEVLSASTSLTEWSAFPTVHAHDDSVNTLQFPSYRHVPSRAPPSLPLPLRLQWDKRVNISLAPSLLSLPACKVLKLRGNWERRKKGRAGRAVWCLPWHNILRWRVDCKRQGILTRGSTTVLFEDSAPAVSQQTAAP